MLVRFPNQSGLVVQHDRSDWLKRNLLAKAGKDFTPPEVVFDHGERVVRFLAVSSNGWALFSVEGRLGNDVSVKAEMLSHF
jgi:hypothetical protein